MSGIKDVEMALVERFRSLSIEGQLQTLAYTETLRQEFNVPISDRPTTLRQILALSRIPRIKRIFDARWLGLGARG
jgi:hypothetical protein